MRITVFTIFPELVRQHTSTSLLGRAAACGLVCVEAVDIRVSATGRHRQVDDGIFGGGPGMVMKPDVVADSLDAHYEAIEAARRIVLTPAGRRLDQAMLWELHTEPALALLCGRYEGVDQRVLDAYRFEPVSIGDYVIAGGELAALVLIEGVTRLVPGVMGNAASAGSESFEGGMLEPPAYTRPSAWRGMAVPNVLLSGDHGAVAAWRRHAAIRRTAAIRPDLLADAVNRGEVAHEDLEAAGLNADTILE